MTAPRDPDRLIRAFLDEGDDYLQDQVYDEVRAAIQHRRQRVYFGPWRTPIMSKFITVGLGAAAVVVIGILLGSQVLTAPGGNTGGDVSTPEPTPTVEPTPQPTPTPTPAGMLPEGPHMILDGAIDDSQSEGPPLTVTIPAPGWFGDVGGGILTTREGGMIVFVQEEYLVFADACHYGAAPPEAVSTVDDLITALASHGSREASEPVDINLDGYAGKSIVLQAPDDLDVSDCDPLYGGSWDCGGGGRLEPCGYSEGTGEIETVYALDVGGAVMAWVTVYAADAPDDVIAEFEAIVQSADFGS
jgi:hypothetical protein